MPESKPFVEHFYELRRRLAKVAVVLLLGAAVGYWLRFDLLELLVKPLNQPLYYTTPGGGFDFVIKLCVFFGVVISTPVMVTQLFKFLQPVMPKESTRFIRVGAVASVFLLILGVLFGYYVSLPAALHFLHEFSNDSVRSLITTNEYFSFVMIYLAGFGLLFQLPIIVLFINRIKPLKPSKMLKSERWVVLGSFVAAAVITPTPDPLNQIMMAAPIILLYNLSLALVIITNRGQKYAQPAMSIRSTPLPTAVPAPVAAPTILRQFQAQSSSKPNLVPQMKARRLSIDGIAMPTRVNLATAQRPVRTMAHPAPHYITPAAQRRPQPRLAFDVF